jgi:hypothetical protein
LENIFEGKCIMHVKLKIQKNNILQEAFLNLDIGTLEISDNWELSSMASEHGKYLNKLMWK